MDSDMLKKVSSWGKLTDYVCMASGKKRDDDQIRRRSQPTNEPGPNCNERGFETWAGKIGTQVAHFHRRRETRACEDYS